MSSASTATGGHAKPLRILHVCPVYAHGDYRAAGVSKAAFDLAHSLAEAGHTVRFVCPLVDHDQAFVRPEMDTWCDGRLRLFYVDGARSTRFGTSHHGCVNALQEHLTWAGVAHVHAFFSPWTDRAIGCLRAAGVPYFVQPHGKLSPAMLANRGVVKRLYMQLRGRKLLRDAAAVMLLAEPIAASVSEWDDQIRTRVCPNGLNPAEYVERHQTPPLDGPYVLFFGMLDPRKRLDLLIEAFAAAETGDWRLALVGGDAYQRRARLEKLVLEREMTDRVVFPGHVTGDGKLQWLQHAGLFALSSEAEGLSLAMLEALACGVPCLLSPGCNAPEVETAGAGEVIPLTVNDWAVAFERWIQNPERRHDAGNQAQRLFRQRFTIAQVAESMVGFYREAVL